jgi:hypothetical protein
VERLGLGDAFAILTLWAPHASAPERSTDEQDALEREDVRRVLRLEEALTLARVPFRHATARSLDGERRERCVAVALPREAAAAFARGRGQRVLFWYDGERIGRWPSAPGAGPEPLAAP